MPAPYTPTARIAAADPAMPDGPPENAATSRDLLDARAYGRQVAWGALVWGNRIAVSGTAAHPVLSCDQIDIVALCDSSAVWWPAYSGAVTIPEAAMALPLTSSTRYNVFAKVSTSGVLGFEVTTAGRDSAVYRTVGSEQRRFLGTFSTDASGNPIPGWIHERGASFRATSATSLRVLNAGDATSFTSVDLSAFLPPRATAVHLAVSLTNAGTHASPLTAYGRAPGDAGSIQLSVVPAVSSSSAADNCTARLPVAGSAIEYQLSAAPEAANGLTLYVTGWEE